MAESKTSKKKEQAKKKKSFAAELRAMKQDELQQELLNAMRQKFKLSIAKVEQNLAQPHLVREVRRRIARIKTVMCESSS